MANKLKDLMRNLFDDRSKSGSEDIKRKLICIFTSVSYLKKTVIYPDLDPKRTYSYLKVIDAEDQ